MKGVQEALNWTWACRDLKKTGSEDGELEVLPPPKRWSLNQILNKERAMDWCSGREQHMPRQRGRGQASWMPEMERAYWLNRKADLGVMERRAWGCSHSEPDLSIGWAPRKATAKMWLQGPLEAQRARSKGQSWVESDWPQRKAVTPGQGWIQQDLTPTSTSHSALSSRRQRRMGHMAPAEVSGRLWGQWVL